MFFSCLWIFTSNCLCLPHMKDISEDPPGTPTSSGHLDHSSLRPILASSVPPPCLSPPGKLKENNKPLSHSSIWFFLNFSTILQPTLSFLPHSCTSPGFFLFPYIWKPHLKSICILPLSLVTGSCQNQWLLLLSGCVKFPCALNKALKTNRVTPLQQFLLSQHW